MYKVGKVIIDNTYTMGNYRISKGLCIFGDKNISKDAYLLSLLMQLHKQKVKVTVLDYGDSDVFKTWKEKVNTYSISNDLNMELIVKKNTYVDLKQLQKEKVSLNYFLTTFLKKLGEYLHEHREYRDPLKHVLVLSNTADCMNSKEYTRILETFLEHTYPSPTSAIVLVDERVDEYDDMLLHTLYTKLIFKYSGNPLTVKEKLKLDSIKKWDVLPANCAYLFAGMEEQLLLIEETGKEKPFPSGLSYEEHLDLALKENDFDFVKQKGVDGIKYLLLEEQMILFLSNEDSIHVNKVLLYAMKAEEEKLLDMLSNVLNKKLPYFKYALIEHELKALYDDIIFSKEDIYHFVSKLKKMKSILVEVDQMMKKYGMKM